MKSNSYVPTTLHRHEVKQLRTHDVEVGLRHGLSELVARPARVAASVCWDDVSDQQRVDLIVEIEEAETVPAFQNLAVSHPVNTCLIVVTDFLLR